MRSSLQITTAAKVTARRHGRAVTVKGTVTGLPAPEGLTVAVKLTAKGKRVAVAHELLDGRGRFTAKLRTKAGRKLAVRVTAGGTSAKARVR